mgnify:CR=1 FL=1
MESNIFDHKFIVIDGGHFNPLGIVRSLGEKGISSDVIVIDSPDAIMAQSKYVNSKVFVKSAEEGVEYILLIPRRYMRIRLFCLWPLLMAAENLKAIGDGHIVFDSVGKVKISRKDVKRIIKSTSWHFYSNRWIRKTFEELHP